MHRTFLRLDLALDEPFRVGVWLGSDPDQRTDGSRQTTAKDPNGNVYVPASGIAGSLRAHVGKDAVELFGPTLKERKDKLAPSPWAVRGVVVRPGLSIEERGQTAIDRQRRAASTKFHRRAEEVVPSSTGQAQLHVYLTGKDAPLDLLLGHLKRWKPTVGGGLSRGLGRARLIALTYRTLDLSKDADLIELARVGGGPSGIDRILTNKDGQELVKQLGPKDLSPPKIGQWVIQCSFVNNLGLPAPEQPEKKKVDPLEKLHGSALKGILRSRVEFIGRSLGWPVCLPTDTPAPRERCDDCPPQSWCDKCKANARCDVCKAFGSTERPAALTFRSSALSVDGPVHTRHRVAINRFTGGSQQWQRNDQIQGALFSDHTEHAAPFEVTIERRRSVAPWIEYAVLHAWRDLHDGLIAVGPRTATGLGSIRVDGMECPADAPVWAQDLPAVPLPGDSDRGEAKHWHGGQEQT